MPQKNSKNDLKRRKIIDDIDQELNLSMARLNKVHQQFLNFRQEHKQKKDQKRLKQLRKDILNK